MIIKTEWNDSGIDFDLFIRGASNGISFTLAYDQFFRKRYQSRINNISLT